MMFQIKGMSKEQSVISLYVILTVITALFSRNMIISLGIGAAEVIFVIWIIMAKDAGQAILWMLFFISTEIGNTLFAFGSKDIKIYSFSALPGIRTYHILFLLAVLLLQCFPWKQKNFRLSQYHPWVTLSFLWGLASAVSLLTLIVNDNGVSAVWGLVRFVIVDCYNLFFTIAVFAVIYKCLKENDKFAKNVKTLFVGILKGITIAAVILIFLGNVRIANGGEAVYLICPLILYWAPALLLFYVEEKRISYIIYGLAAAAVQIRYTVGIPGTWWLSTGLIMLAFVIDLIKIIRKKGTLNQGLAAVLLLGTIIIGTGAVLVIRNINGNDYIMYKLRTVKSLLSFSSSPSQWLYGMGASVGIRVEEIINIVLEYIKKPVYFFIGKGFGGTIRYHWGVHNWDYEAAFTEVQRVNGVFSNFHTGAAEMMINFGFIGFCFVLLWIKDLIKSIFGKKRNPWIIIGTMYMLLFYSYYWGMAVCIAIFAYGVFVKDYGQTDQKISTI